MTREEFKNIVKGIRGAYTSCPIVTQKIFDLWYEMLKDMEYAEVSKNLEKHIKTNKFAPSISELRGETPSRNLGNFRHRSYDMDELERELLEVAVEENRNIEGGCNGNFT